MLEKTNPDFALFAQLPDDFVRALAARGVVRHLPRNAMLMTEGTVSDRLYVILDGRVRVFSADVEGREIVIDIRGPGEIIGELAIDGRGRAASVATLETCVVAELSHAALRDEVATNPDFAWRFILTLTERVREATATARDLALLDVYGRIVKLLGELAMRDGNAHYVGRITQQEIAERVGASRDMVARVLKALCDGGYIAMDGKRIDFLKALPARG